MRKTRWCSSYALLRILQHWNSRLRTMELKVIIPFPTTTFTELYIFLSIFTGFISMSSYNIRVHLELCTGPCVRYWSDSYLHQDRVGCHSWHLSHELPVIRRGRHHELGTFRECCIPFLIPSVTWPYRAQQHRVTTLSKPRPSALRISSIVTGEVKP